MALDQPETKGNKMNLTPMDYVRAAIANAFIEDMTVQDLYAMSLNAKTAQDFDNAVNILSNTMPAETVSLAIMPV